MSRLVFSRKPARFAAARLAGTLMPGRGATVGPLALEPDETLPLPSPEWLRLRPRLAGKTAELDLERTVERVRACGVLDFQNAGLGPIGYDLISLIEDARRDVGDTGGERTARRRQCEFSSFHGSLTIGKVSNSILARPPLRASTFRM